MTIHSTVKGVLSRTIRPSAPTADAPVHLVSNARCFAAAATWIAECQRRAGLSQNFWDDQKITKPDVFELLSDCRVEVCQETAARTGLIGIMHSDNQD